MDAERQVHSQSVAEPGMRSNGTTPITGRRLQVATVAEALAAGEQRDAVAEMWDITPEAVDDAVRCSNVA